MRLASMRYKDYVWPHNPRVYTIEYKRTMGARKVPFGRYHLQDLGPAQRVMRGEGEFVGEGAYGEFKKLATVFYAGGPDKSSTIFSTAETARNASGATLLPTARSREAK